MRGDYLRTEFCIMQVSGKGEEVMPYVSVEKKNAVAVVTIDRPEALNALNSEVLGLWRERWTLFSVMNPSG